MFTCAKQTPYLFMSGVCVTDTVTLAPYYAVNCALHCSGERNARHIRVKTHTHRSGAGRRGAERGDQQLVI
jgi:hypothetical protein